MQNGSTNSTVQEVNSPEKAPSATLKIGGFLIVVAVSLALSFLKNLGNLGVSLVPFRSGTWELVTTPGLKAYHPYWKPVLLFGIISASVILALNALALFLFFRRHRFFPTFMVVVIPVIFVLMLAGYFLDGLVPAVAASQYYAKQGQALILSFIALHVWLPYFVISDRVRRTFVR